MSRSASAWATRADTPSSRKDCIRLLLLRVKSRSACLDCLAQRTGKTEEEQTSQDDTTPSMSNTVATAPDPPRPPIGWFRDLVRQRRSGARVPRRRAARGLRPCRRSKAIPRCSRTGPAAATGRCGSGSGARHGVDPGRVIVTNGGLQGFVFYAEELLAERPGRVLVEAPTYDRPLKILARLGAEVVPVPMDAEGLDPDALERELERRRHELRLHDPDLPESERADALDRAAPARRRARAEHGVPVLEDDPYGLVRYEGERRRRCTSSRAATSSPTLVVLEDGRARRAGRLVRRPAGAGRADRGPSRLDLHLAALPHPGDGPRADRPRRLRAEPRADPRPPEAAARRDARRARARADRRRDLERARGRLLPLGRPADRRGRAARPRRSRRRHVRQGRRLLSGRRRWIDVRPARVQLRLTVGDRLGRLDARGAADACATDGGGTAARAARRRRGPARSESRITQISDVRASPNTKSTPASSSFPTTNAIR